MSEKFIINGIETQTKTILFNDIDNAYRVFEGHILEKLSLICSKYPNISEDEKLDCLFLIRENLAQTENADLFYSKVHDISKDYCTLYFDFKNTNYDNNLNSYIEQLIEQKMCLYCILVNFENLTETNFQNFYDFICKHTFNLQLNIKNVKTPLIKYIKSFQNKNLVICDETDFFDKISYAIKMADSVQVPLFGISSKKIVEISNLLKPIGKTVFYQPYSQPIPECFEEKVDFNKIINLYKKIRTEIDDDDYSVFMNNFGILGMRTFDKEAQKIYETKDIDIFISKTQTRIPSGCSSCKIKSICSCSNNTNSECELVNYVLQM